MTPATFAKLNAAGVLALSALCFTQWRDNAAARRTCAELESRASRAEAEVVRLAGALAGAKSDIEDFRSRLTRTEGELAETVKSLTAERRRAELAERQVSELRDAVTKWGEAVQARDRRITEYESALAASRAETADAVRRHNEVVSRLNDTAARFALLVDALGDEAAPVKLTREAIPAPARITEPGKPARDIAPEEAAKLVERLAGRTGHSYPKPHEPKPETPATLVEGDGLRLFLFSDGSARFERPDLRVHLPASR